jgi:predicted RNA-binding Zn-ribbon protein involved in translation (DUF1610 family)
MRLDLTGATLTEGRDSDLIDCVMSSGVLGRTDGKLVIRKPDKPSKQKKKFGIMKKKPKIKEFPKRSDKSHTPVKESENKLSITCEKCNTRLLIAESSIGKKFRCPRCGLVQRAANIGHANGG